jgi:hypothetical protein
MKQLFKETGALTPKGEEMLRPLRIALEDLLETDEFSKMPEQEVRVLQTQIMKLIGDQFCDKIASKRQRAGRYFNMTDEEFETHIHTKYGNVWMWMTLEPEEMLRYEPIAKKTFDKFVEEMKKIEKSFIPPYMTIRPKGM